VEARVILYALLALVYTLGRRSFVARGRRSQKAFVMVVMGLATSRSGRELGGATTRRLGRSSLGRMHIAKPVTTACKDLDEWQVSCRPSPSVSRRRRWCEIGESCENVDTGRTQTPGYSTRPRYLSKRVKEERAAVISRMWCCWCRGRVSGDGW
jgi:hypothetical protein